MVRPSICPKPCSASLKAAIKRASLSGELMLSIPIRERARWPNAAKGQKTEAPASPTMKLRRLMPHPRPGDGIVHAQKSTLIGQNTASLLRRGCWPMSQFIDVDFGLSAVRLLTLDNDIEWTSRHFRSVPPCDVELRGNASKSPESG